VVERLKKDFFDEKTNGVLQEKEGAVIVEYNDGEIKIVDNM
jgi:hypothetical protein